MSDAQSSSRRGSSRSGSSSIRNQKTKSKIKLRLAALANQQEAQRLEDVKLRARAEAEAEIRRVELACRDKQRELELARLEAEAWEDAEREQAAALSQLDDVNPQFDLAERCSPLVPCGAPELIPSPVSTGVLEPCIEPTPLVYRASHLPSIVPDQEHKISSAVPQNYTRCDENVRKDLCPQPQPREGCYFGVESQEPSMAGMGERLLPRPTIEKFDGDPMNYWTFVRQFNAHIMRKVEGDDLRLLFLIQHCEPKVRTKIDHLTSKPHSVGFRMAWNILFEEYGRPHEIARCCEEHLRNSPKVHDHDREGLKRLSVLMDKCCTSLKDADKSYTLDSMELIVSIVMKLPPRMRERWVERSVQIECRTADRAGFADLAEFVAEQSRIASSIYGRVIFPMSSSTTKTQWSKQRCMATESINDLKGQRISSCVCCGKNHQLAVCDEFKRKSYQERKSFVKLKQLCFKCLKANHVSRECRSRENCNVNGCSGGQHHTLLHIAQQTPNKESADADREQPTEYCANVSTASTYLNVVPVNVRFGGSAVATYAFLDQGSTASFCEKSLIDLLGASGDQRRLTMQTMTSTKTLDTISVKLEVQPLEGGNWLNMNDVVVIDDIPVKPNTYPHAKTLRRHRYLHNIELLEIKNGTVQLLIGANVPAAFRVESMREGGGQLPDAVRGPLGWSLFGPSFGPGLPSDKNVNAVQTMFLSDERDLMSIVDSSHEGEESESLCRSLEDQEMYGMMQKSLEFVDGHYQLPLPWRHDHQILPDNKMMAKKRLTGLQKKLSRDPELCKRYVAQINTLLDNDYAEEVPDEEINTTRRKWFLPHHAVINPRKPEKLRIVFDCAAQHQGMSINQALMQGPDLVNSLVGVLTRFRKHPVAITADVEAMFHQVKVAPRDRDSLRFWWWPNGDITKEPAPHRMKVHLFGATSSPTCASFCLRQAAVDFGGQFEAYVTHAVKNNFYVDDCLVSVSNERVGVKLIHDLRELLSRAGFNLTKCLSNSQQVVDSIPEKDQSKSLTTTPLNNGLQQRVLGIDWNLNSDCFTFAVALPVKPRTRRGMLSTVNSLFDPLGFLAPVVLEARLIYRCLCQQELEWDEPLPPDELLRWERWLSTLPDLRNVTISRWLKFRSGDDEDQCQLHYFADASKNGYGAVCYVRTVDNDGKVHCSLLMAKSHLAPKDETSIPRLELMAAVVAVKLDKRVRKELGMTTQRYFFWSDSAIVIQSLLNKGKRFPLFVFRRLEYISRNSNTSNWNHVPSRSNPADLASRGVAAADLLNSDLWFSGPPFLKSDPAGWPSRFKPRKLTDDEVTQFNKKPVAVFALQGKAPAVDQLIMQFSSFFKLKRAAAWLLKYKQFLMHRKKKIKFDETERNLRVEDLTYAETELVKYVQRQQFSSWIVRIKDHSSISTGKVSVLNKMNPILVDGVLRVGGRLDKAPIPYEARHPAILPHTSHLTELIVNHYHVQAGHSGLNHTLSLVTQHYWIVKGTSAVKRILRQCAHCRLRNAKPGQQIMAELPRQRLGLEMHPFTFTGVDFFGPFLVRYKRSEVKRYGCLFTCLTTRAVHLELAEDLSTDAFINVLRRFVCRRGPVTNIYSDNGTNFVGAERLLREAIQNWNHHKVESFLQQKEIQWHFNPPTASHMGGAWERMIRSVRRILLSLASERTLTDDQLHTLLLETESILNSRPLIPVTMDDDNATPLTPDHLLKLNSACNLPPTLTDKKDCFVRRRWKYVQYLADQFWRRWSREYLKTIISRQKWLGRKENFKIDDVVLLVDDSTPRSRWVIGKITNVYPDVHGVVRSVSVKARGNEMKRPIHKLCLIVPASNPDDGEGDDHCPNTKTAMKDK